MELQTDGEIKNMQSAHSRYLREQGIAAAMTAALYLAECGLPSWTFFSTGDSMRLHDMMGMIILQRRSHRTSVASHIVTLCMHGSGFRPAVASCMLLGPAVVLQPATGCTMVPYSPQTVNHALACVATRITQDIRLRLGLVSLVHSQ
jgi:hypothetical protein